MPLRIGSLVPQPVVQENTPNGHGKYG
jgi:hypothetical protein